MRFSYTWLQDYVDLKGVSAEKAAEALTMHSFEVKEVSPEGDDLILDIDLLPNRIPDAASHLGVARELAVLFGKKLKTPQPIIKEDRHLKTVTLAQVKVEAPDLCSRYSSRVITEVVIGDSPARLKERLKTIGLKPINNVVDAANYIMLELGQPLHVFDLDKILKKTIIVRRAKKGEKIETLDGERYTLTPEDLVIADAKEPIAIAGIKGGRSSAVSAETKNLLLESANFDQAAIRQTAKRLSLRTDASVRFGAGLNPAFTPAALDRLAELIISLAGGRIAAGLIDVKKKLPAPAALAFSLEEINQFLGLAVNQRELIKILSGLGFAVRVKDKKIVAVVPFFRTDLERKEDVFEEIGRLWGYEKIPAVPIRGELRPVRLDEDRLFRERVENILVKLGFRQVLNYSFVSGEDNRLEQSLYQKQWELANPVSFDKQFLRQSLLPGLARTVQVNQRFQDRLNLFEVGTVYSQDRNQPQERWQVGLIQAETRPQPAEESFYTFKGRLETFLEELGIQGAWFDNVIDEDDRRPGWLHPARRAVIYTEEKKYLGRLGELHPDVTQQYGLFGRTLAALFDIETLQAVALADTFFREIPKFPPVKRDIALLVPHETRIAEIENVIYGAGAKHLVDVDLFDIYDEVGEEGLKSVAFHLIFQSDTRTLTAREVDREEQKIKRTLEKELGATIR